MGRLSGGNIIKMCGKNGDDEQYMENIWEYKGIFSKISTTSNFIKQPLGQTWLQWKLEVSFVSIIFTDIFWILRSAQCSLSCAGLFIREKNNKTFVIREVISHWNHYSVHWTGQSPSCRMHQRLQRTDNSVRWKLPKLSNRIGNWKFLCYFDRWKSIPRNYFGHIFPIPGGCARQCSHYCGINQ